ncbi:zinc-binding dehydrogenase [Spirillospora albida]|uniref:zinc-binding dehydrogenase n=1 Tax=Spirillospora albida TaxID=58123 RepID=UPI0004C18280|nr:zinc-binding dehydrogenase [Spirillospora albida]
MRAALTTDRTMIVTDVPDPVPQEGQLLVRTLACGICGSDLHALEHPDAFMDTTRRSGGTPYDPRDGLVFGHEFAGEVVERGPGTEGRFPVGTAVCGPPIGIGPQGAGIIGYTPMYPGGYGEYMIVNEGLVFAVPDGLDPKVAAITEPFSVGTRAVDRSGIGADDVAVVLGLGPIGLGVVAVLKARGHGPVLAADFSPKRRALAEGLGADEVIDPAAGSPFDRWADLGVPTGTVDRIAAELLGVRAKQAVIFECVGVPGVLGRVVEGAPAGSTVMVVGVCMEPDEIEPGVAVSKELTIRGTFGALPAEYGATLAAIGDGRIDAGSIITGTVGLDGVMGAFSELGAPERHAKIVVVP